MRGSCPCTTTLHAHMHAHACIYARMTHASTHQLDPQGQTKKLWTTQGSAAACIACTQPTAKLQDPDMATHTNPNASNTTHIRVKGRRERKASRVSPLSSTHNAAQPRCATPSTQGNSAMLPQGKGSTCHAAGREANRHPSTDRSMPSEGMATHCGEGWFTERRRGLPMLACQHRERESGSLLSSLSLPLSMA